MGSSSRWADVDALVRACLSGDADAWETLIRRYRRLIYSIPVAFRIPTDQADDVFQRVALKLLENLHQLRSIDGLVAWISVMTRRECLALLQGENRYRGIAEEDMESSGVALAQDSDVVLTIEQEHALVLALERLGEPCRGLLGALYVERPTPSYEEIGQRLGRPVGSLGPTRSRCLSKLRKLYLEEGGPPPIRA